MTLSEELLWRGQLKDKTFDDPAWLDTPRTFYLGADAGSADSLTIGNLAVYMMARRLVDAGWTPILLVGGATSRIGDPGGKDSERDLVSEKEIDRNIEGIRGQVEQLFAGRPFTVVNNYDWFKDINYLDFLRDVGKHFSMSELISRDFIAQRMGQGGGGISYAEFSYSLIQGYDYYHLATDYNVELQIGGSDQWGNMLSGVPLIRKKINKEVHAASMPLVINKSTGKKFGKSEEGAVWLDAAKTSVYKFYQFWLNVDDAGVEEYLKIYTLLNKDEIADVLQGDTAGRRAQKVLAYETTKLVHGADRANEVVNVTSVLFGDMMVNDLSDAEVDKLAGEIPAVHAGKTLVEVLQEAGVVSSGGEARRLIQGGGVSINGAKAAEDRAIDELSLVKKGKNTFILVRP
jgi:tyrosyl-tRNA synthetase